MCNVYAAHHLVFYLKNHFFITYTLVSFCVKPAER